MPSKLRTRRLLKLIACLYLAFASLGCSKDEMPGNCTPTFLGQEETLEVEVGDHWQFEVDFILIGCEENLHLEDDDIARVRGVISDFITEYHMIFYRKTREKPFRDLVCGRINESLGQGAHIDDIYFSEVNFSEERPLP